MAKKMTREKSANASKNLGSVGGYKVLGRTRDGVRILEPKGKPTSFTVAKLRKAIRSVRASNAG